MTLHEALKLLRAAGLDEVKCGLPELHPEDAADDWAVYHSDRHGVSFSVRPDGTLVDPEGFRRQVAGVKQKR